MVGFTVAVGVFAMTGADLRLSSGLVIDRSCRIAREEVVIAGGDLDAPAIVIKGSGITVDFNNSVLRGSVAAVEPDQRTGFGIKVVGKNVTLRNLNVHGYKVAVYAENADGLRIENADLSYNWKQRLKSGRMREDVGDWMSFHQNEKQEWLRFGAGLYLCDIDGFEIKDVTVRGGQCGLMLTRCTKGKIWNNDFSFLSAIGIGMYRSSENQIMHNKVDWCVRGYSHWFYNRGQDSAGILMYEQSSNNVIAYNSVTHGGDGLFLWAGQSTMDTGKGGCNDNIFYGNDFSHAPTNGIETTFSRNRFVNNLVLECWHGVWGGYSYASKFIGNTFGMNGEAIAIEHGQNNEIAGNLFRMDTYGIYLWMRPGAQPADWGYPKNRDTRSHRYRIENNVFYGIPETVFVFDTTDEVRLKGNFVKKFKTAFEISSVSSVSDTTSTYLRKGLFDWPVEVKRTEVALGENSTEMERPYMARNGLVVRRDADPTVFRRVLRESEWNPAFLADTVGKTPDEMSPEELRDHLVRPHFVKPLFGGQIPFLGPEALRGRAEILVNEWGPIDFRSPVLWLDDWFDTPDGKKYYVFRVIGPEGGGWRLKSSTNAEFAKMLNEWQGKIPQTPPFVHESTAMLTGDVGDKLLVKSSGQFMIELEYTGPEVVDYRGVRVSAGTPVAFGYTHDEVPIKWAIEFWNYDRAVIDPREKPEEFRKIYETPAEATIRSDSLEGAWSGSPAAGINANAFATLAEGRVNCDPGEYELSVTSDDGVRVLVDGQVVFEDWTWHAPKTDVLKLKLGGRHTIRIEHFELDGYSALQVRMRRLGS
jgi:hypothetical protein